MKKNKTVQAVENVEDYYEIYGEGMAQLSLEKALKDKKFMDTIHALYNVREKLTKKKSENEQTQETDEAL